MFNNTNATSKPSILNNFVYAFYDAVILYSLALRETLDAGGDPRNGTAVTERMWNRSFEGLANNITMDENGDRYCDFAVFDLDVDKDEFVEVAVYSGKSDRLTIMGAFHWPGAGRPPPDWPICGWDMSLCSSGMTD